MRSLADEIPPRERTLAPDVLAWIGAYLLQPDGPEAGEPLRLTREMARILARWYAVDERGRFVYRRGVLRRMKGWAKSYVAAVIGAVELCGPCRCDGFDAEGLPVAVPHTAPWVVCAATSIDQTRNTSRYLAAMFSDAAIDDYGLDLGRLIVHSRLGQLEAVTSNPRAVEGARSTFVLMDETQEWLEANKGLEMARAIRRNVAKLGNARTIETCNAHRPGEASVAEETFLAWSKAGEIPGLMYDSLEAPDVPDLADEDALRAALEVARGDSTWLDLDRLADEIRDPVTPASVSRRYYLNAVVEASEDRWMDAALWDSLARPEKRIPAGSTVVLGFDGSYRDDHTALTVVMVEADGGRHLDLVKMWAPDGSAEWTAPVLEVEDEIRRCCERWEVREVVADPSRWQRSLEVLRRDLLRPGRREVVAYPQSPQRMAEAANSFVQALKAGTLTHSGDPTLRRYVMNAVAVETHSGVRIRKRSAPAKIDAAIAAIMAHHRALRYEHRPHRQVLYTFLDDLIEPGEEPPSVEELRERYARMLETGLEEEAPC